MLVEARENEVRIVSPSDRRLQLPTSWGVSLFGVRWPVGALASWHKKAAKRKRVVTKKSGD
jgi:hypothetical protein